MSLNWNEIESRALLFSKTWDDACNENSQAKPFWIDFFEIFGITNKRVATFELNVKKLGGAQGFVDLFWPGMLLVEHKSLGKNLDDAVDQAVGYLHHLKEHELPQLVVVCDFAHFRVYRLATGETVAFELKHLHKHIKLFGLLAGYKVQDIRAEDPVNIKAAERMGRLHDALKASGYSGHALEVLLVRLLFCLFADDTGIFQPAQSFRDFVEERTAPDGSDLGPRLGQLFQVLNTPERQRSKNIDEQLGQFAYINGKLFEETLPMADFSTAMREALLDACALDWSAISPAIFGSLFQSIMDDKARRNLGAHYTSEANILKLIKPLFLDELHAEFERVKGNRNKLFEFHKKLRQLTFMDPACGCGNFLVISYRELRELELKVLRASHELSAHRGQLAVDVHGLIGVNVDQFFGMEIEEFPAQIAQVALWLVDHQMNLRVSVEFGLYFARIPLTSTPQIRHANALRLDWNEVLPAERCSYPQAWIEKRLRSISVRGELTDEWKARGVAEGKEYSILTAEIARATFGVTPVEHSQLKGLDVVKTGNKLRDHMTDLELIFTMLGEASTTEIARRSDALGFDENRTSAKEGGKIAGNARKALEAKTGKEVVSKANYLATAPSPGLLDVPQPAAPSQPKVRVRSKVPKGE